jgi:hypothetical protein
LDDPGTGRGRVEHARAARWLTSQRTPQFNAVLECVVPSTAILFWRPISSSSPMP